MDPATTLPTGTVTFLFTDSEGSPLWEEHSEARDDTLDSTPWWVWADER
jgi:hypothetical protein